MDKAIYRLGTDADEQAILDFANMVFSMSHSSVDFEQELPKVYRADRRGLTTHHLLTVNGEIRALIDTYPLQMTCAGHVLRCAFIGTVSVHPKFRGRGYMTELLRHAQEALRADGCELLMLCGDRHRYQPFGFEKAGMKYCFKITDSALRHTPIEKRRISFRDIGENDTELIDAAYALYRQRHVTARDRQSFYVSLLSWRARPCAVLDGSDFLGYLDASADFDILYEFELAQPSLLPAVVCAYFKEFFPDRLTCNIGADESDYIRCLEPLASYYTLTASHQLKIMDYEKTIAFMLRWKQQYTYLEDGTCTVRIDDETYTITIAGGCIRVERTSDAPQLTFDRLTFVKTMMSPYYYRYAAVQGQGKPCRRLLPTWFPLPFFLPEPDVL